MDKQQLFCDTKEKVCDYNLDQLLIQLSDTFDIYYISEKQDKGSKVDYQLSAYTEFNGLINTYDVELKTINFVPKKSLLLEVNKYKSIKSYSDNKVKYYVNFVPSVQKVYVLDLTNLNEIDLHNFYEVLKVTNPMNNEIQTKKVFNIPISYYKEIFIKNNKLK